MYERKLSLDDYFTGRMLSDPLRLFDFCLETDGACAVVVTTTDRAQRSASTARRDQGRRPGERSAAGGGMLFPVLARSSR